MMKILSVTCCMLIVAFMAIGCGKQESEPSTSAPTVPTETTDTFDSMVKSMDEYREDAAESITEENVQEELDRLQQEIEEDVAANQ